MARRRESKWERLKYFFEDLFFPAEIVDRDPWSDDPWEEPEVTDQWTEVVAAYRRSNGACGVCGEEVDLSIEEGPNKPTVDHIYPMSRGGADTRKNIQLAHMGCNSRKGAELPEPGRGEFGAWGSIHEDIYRRHLAGEAVPELKRGTRIADYEEALECLAKEGDQEEGRQEGVDEQEGDDEEIAP